MFYNIKTSYSMVMKAMSKSVENPRPTKPTTKTPRRAKPRQSNVRFEATIHNDHVDLRASAPTKWFRVLLRVLVILLIALVILKMPELWQAIQTALHLIPK